MEIKRSKFEDWAVLPPREWEITIYPDNSEWPGCYVDYSVQCAWEAWKEVNYAAKDIRKLTSEGLSVEFSKRGRAKAQAISDDFRLEEYGKALLDNLMLEEMKNGTAGNKARPMARNSSQYKTHTEGRVASIYGKNLMIAEYAECNFEIKRRLNKSFAEYSQRKADGMTT